MDQMDTFALRNWDTFIKDAALRTDNVFDEAIAQKVAECFIQNGMPTPRKALSATKKTFNKAMRMSSATFPKDTPGDLLMETVTTRLEDFEDAESEEEVEEKPFADMSEEDDSLVQRRLLDLEIKELVDDWHDTKKDLLKKIKPKWNDKLSVQHFCDVAVPTAVSEAALGRARSVHTEAQTFLNGQKEAWQTHTAGKWYQNADTATKAGHAFEQHHQTSLGVNERLIDRTAFHPDAIQEPTQFAKPDALSDLSLQVEVPVEGQPGTTELKVIKHQMKCTNNPADQLKDPKYDGMRKVVPSDKLPEVQERMNQVGNRTDPDLGLKRSEHQNPTDVTDRVKGQVKDNFGREVTSDPVTHEEMQDMVEVDDVTGEDHVHDEQQQKLDANKPSRALAVIITTSCATVLATSKQVTQLWPLYKRGDIGTRELILAACTTAMITACMAGGIGGLLAILEEVAPEIAQAAGPLMLFGLVAVQAGRAIKEWYQGKITASEMTRRIGEVISQAGGGYGGAVIGMFVGAAFGPIGTLIGGCIGGFIGAEVGAALFNWFWSGVQKVFGTRDFDYWIHNLKYKHRHHGHMVSLDSKVVQYLTEVYEGTMFSKKNGRQTMLNGYEECNTQLERHFRQFALHTHRDHLPPGHTQADALAADAALIAAKDSVLALKAMMKEKFPRAEMRAMRDQDKQLQEKDTQIQKQDQEIQRLKEQLAQRQTASCQRGQLRLRNSC